MTETSNPQEWQIWDKQNQYQSRLEKKRLRVCVSAIQSMCHWLYYWQYEMWDRFRVVIAVCKQQVRLHSPRAELRTVTAVTNTNNIINWFIYEYITNFSSLYKYRYRMEDQFSTDFPLYYSFWSAHQQISDNNETFSNENLRITESAVSVCIYS